MYSRSESGDGIARNLASQSRWTLADSAVKPRRSPIGAGARARSRMPRPQAAIGRALMRIRTEPRGRVVGGPGGGRGGPLLVFQLVPRIQLTPAHHQGDLSDVADVGEPIGAQPHQVRRGSSADGTRAVETEGASRVRGRRDEHAARREARGLHRLEL